MTILTLLSMAGAGRTGTLISLASLLSDRQAGTKSTKLPSNSRHSDPVYATVDSIRDYRSRQVLTPGQLGLIHDIVDSKNGVPFSSIKRTAPADSAITTYVVSATLETDLSVQSRVVQRHTAPTSRPCLRLQLPSLDRFLHRRFCTEMHRNCPSPKPHELNSDAGCVLNSKALVTHDCSSAGF